MKQYQGAIFSDIDGTLVDEQQRIFQPTPKVKAAFRELKERGYLIGIATGRAQCYIPDLGIDFDCYVSCNGAVAEVAGKKIFDDYIADEQLQELIAYMDQENIGYILENSKQCLYQKSAEKDVKRILEIFHLDPSVFTPLKTLEGFKTNQLMITFEKMEQLEKIREHFLNEYLIAQHRGTYSADLGKKTITKASGIHAVLTHFGIDKDNAYAFGDHYNDLEMLAEVKHSVAMTPHADVLEEVAEYVTGSVAGDGIYQGLKHYGLVD